MEVDQESPHFAAGWNGDHSERWIEVGRLRLEEDDKGASVKLRDQVVSWLSATELAALVRLLGAWFAEDPTSTIRKIEDLANYVNVELEGWNDRARADEEHPPYDELTRALDALLARCRDLREVMNRFAAKADKPVITVDEGAI
jgi:hypothetical protein